MFEVGDTIKCKDGYYLCNHSDNPTGPFEVLKVTIGSAINIKDLRTNRKYTVTCYEYEKVNKDYMRRLKIEKIIYGIEQK